MSSVIGSLIIYIRTSGYVYPAHTYTYTANRAHIKPLRLAAEQHISLPTIPNRGPAIYTLSLGEKLDLPSPVYPTLLPALTVVVIKHIPDRKKKKKKTKFSGGVEKTSMNEMDHSSTAIGLDEKIAVIEPVSPSSSSSSSSPVPAIKLKRKCSSGWTLTNNATNSAGTLLLCMHIYYYIWICLSVCLVFYLLFFPTS